MNKISSKDAAALLKQAGAAIRGLMDENKKLASERDDLLRTKRIEKIARDLDAPTSHVAAFLLHYGVRAVRDGQIDLRQHTTPSRLPRYTRVLVLESNQEEV